MTETGPDAVQSDLYRPSPPEARHLSARPLARIVKRGIDIVVSTTSIFLLLPLLALVAGAISAMDRGSPIERETRLGTDGRSFECLRFRTTEQGCSTLAGKSDDTVPSSSPARMTAFGRVLSATSLDELPMLLNVLRGEMSLVGSRPILAATAPNLEAPSSIPPGLTGIWQVEGAPDATEADKAALDFDYARYWSLRRDFAIILRGVAGAFVRRDGM